MVDKGNPNVFTTFKGRFHLETATVGVWGTNLVTNGDFSNGTTGWLTTNASISASGNELSVLASATNGQARSANIAMTNGHKYYIRAEVKATTDLAKINVAGIGAKAHSGSGNYESLSNAFLWDASTGPWPFRIQDYRTDGWDTIFVKCVALIDLTAAFGAGNEPTAEQMDAYLAAYPNSWFNGSALLTPSHTVDSDVVMLSCTNDVQPIGDWTLNDYTANSPFSTLPSECRPLKTLKIPVVVNDGVDRIVVLTVNTDGTMSLPFDYATATLFISGVNFNISDNWY